MKRLLTNAMLAVGFVGAMMTGTGCMNLEPRPDPTVFYALSGPDPTASAGGGTLRMGIRRIEIPTYLDRKEIVTRRGQSEIVRSQFHRWADGFESSLKRAVGEHLAAQDGIQSALVYPWIGALTFDITVKIWILRFEGTEDGAVRLDANWMLDDPADETVYKLESTHLEGAWTPGDYGSLVVEMDRLLGLWAAEIGAGI